MVKGGVVVVGSYVLGEGVGGHWGNMVVKGGVVVVGSYDRG